VELTKQRKVFAAVLVLGAGAVAFDRFVLGYDAPAASGAAEPVAAPPTSESPAPERPAGRDLTRRLAQAREGLAGGAATSLSVAFVAPAAWFPRPIVVGAAPERPAAEPAIVGELHLRMLGNGIARVNEHVLRVGETRGGITLVSTSSEARRAVVRVGGREITLELPAPLDGAKPR
jgi:hypothetical protein